MKLNLIWLTILSTISCQLSDESSESETRSTNLNNFQNRYIVILESKPKTTRNALDDKNILDTHLNGLRALIKTNRAESHNSTNRMSVTHVKDEIHNVFTSESLTGYSGQFNHDIIRKVKTMKDVLLVEKDGKVMASGVRSTKLLYQSNPPWGLSRLSSRKKINGQKFPAYIYEQSGGAGVTAYIIDSGINIDHREFGGRARWGRNFVRHTPNFDENGHGTHVAGTVGSLGYGVAKNVELVAVKVLDRKGSGSTSDIIAGIDWALQDSRSRGGKRGSVANLSLGGTPSRALNMAVENASRSGLAIVVAAGNENDNACNHSPSSAKNILSVGSTDRHDRRSSFSNYGRCVNIFAPGEDILSTYIRSNRDTKSLSGTSMAAPHIAGLLATFMSKSPTKLTPAAAYDIILRGATTQAITKLDDRSPNLLAYNLASMG